MSVSSAIPSDSRWSIKSPSDLSMPSTSVAKACALGGPGWAIVTKNRRDGKLHTYFLAEHHIGLPIDQDLLIVLDSWEHAFMVDYGIARAKYLDTIVDAIKWSEVSKRFAAAK